VYFDGRLGKTWSSLKFGPFSGESRFDTLAYFSEKTLSIYGIIKTDAVSLETNDQGTTDYWWFNDTPLRCYENSQSLAWPIAIRKSSASDPSISWFCNFDWFPVQIFVYWCAVNKFTERSRWSTNAQNSKVILFIYTLIRPLVFQLWGISSPRAAALSDPSQRTCGYENEWMNE